MHVQQRMEATVPSLIMISHPAPLSDVVRGSVSSYKRDD